ncbi:MAG: hypothetical protein WC820_01925 [Spirochaetales bacterium]|jgi:hypothetical protein
MVVDQKNNKKSIEIRSESQSYLGEANTSFPSLISRKTSFRDGNHDAGVFDTPRVIELGNVTERHYYNDKDL